MRFTSRVKLEKPLPDVLITRMSNGPDPLRRAFSTSFLVPADTDRAIALLPSYTIRSRSITEAVHVNSAESDVFPLAYGSLNFSHG